MPNKYPNKKGWKLPKQSYRVSNWADYNKSLKQRGNIEVWFSEEAISKWVEPERFYDGTGSSKYFTDFAILTCHEIRQVYRLPLRQCQGFINSLFRLMKIELSSPDYTCLSKRLAKLKIKSPLYRKTNKPDDTIAAIAIDSTGLKRFGRDEWHQEKHKVSAKRSWRKLHIAVDEAHLIQGADLTSRLMADEKVVDSLIDQINIEVDQVTADGAYDKNHVYDSLLNKFQNCAVIIPPDSDSVLSTNNHWQRNRNLQEIKTFGRMRWQEIREYGNRLHSQEFSRQQNEAMIGCGILNKMTILGMPESYRVA
jgi:hypothetical protein